MTIAPSYFASRSFERPSGNGPMRAESTGEFASLVEDIAPKTENFLPGDITTTPPLLTDADIKPDPGFTEIVDVPPQTDQTDPNSGTSAGYAGDTTDDVNQPPVVADTGGQTNQLPREQTTIISALQDTGGDSNQLPVSPAGETNRLPKPLTLETNQLPKNGNNETNDLPKAASHETTGLLRAQEVIQRSFDRHAALSSNLQMLLELQEAEQK
jgi:hypothetical protein